MSQRSRTSLRDTSEAQLERKNSKPRNSIDKNGINGTASTPVIIEVQGLKEGTDSTRYVIEEMGNTESQVDYTLNKEQTEPLTERKNDKNSNMEKDKNENNSVESGVRDKNERNLEHKHNNGDKIENASTDIVGSGRSRDDDKGRVNGKGEDDLIVTVAGRDDVDAASTYSLFMEKDFRYYFQHPYCRLFFCYFVVFCNFLIYAEDPVAHSIKECLIPMIGNTFAFVGTRYPPDAWSLLKVFLWLVGIGIGMVIGKLFVHGFLFNKLFRLKMFTDDQGSWMIMFLCTLICVFITSLIYNGFLMAGGESTAPYRISDLMGVSNDIFMKVAACGTWCGDFFTAWMVTDIMLQEKLYPGWARPIRRWWTRGWNRIILFWIVVFVSSFVVIFVIATDYIQWDKLNRDFLPTNELSRAFLASFILVMDILIVMQDWDFPHFVSAIDIKLPGVNTAHIRFSIPKCLKRESWQVHITGKWFNYGILFLVMILDMNMWKNQIFYTPYDYGQYTGPDDKIYTVQDQYSLDTYNKSLINFVFRNATINPNTNLTFVSTDTHMNSRYYDVALGVKAIAFFPSLIMFIVFGLLVWFFGRYKPSEKDPYAGRLKKRFKKKKRFSFRMPWKRKEEIRRKIHAVPKLLYFKKKAKDHDGHEIEEREIPSEGFSSDDKELNSDQEIVQHHNDEESKRSFPSIPKVLLFWRKIEENSKHERKVDDIEMGKTKKGRRKLPSIPKVLMFWKKESDEEEEMKETEIPRGKLLVEDVTQDNGGIGGTDNQQLTMNLSEDQQPNIHLPEQEPQTVLSGVQEPSTELTDQEPSTNLRVDPEPTAEIIVREPSTYITDNEPSMDLTDKEPSTDLIDQKQSTNLIDQEPSTDLIDQELSTNTRVQEPSTNITNKEQSTDLIDQEPSTDLTYHEPSTDLTDHEPSTDLTDHEPSTDLTDHEPSTDLTDHEPSTDLTDHEPSTDLTDHEPSIDLTDHEPSTDLTDHEPSTDLKNEEQSPKLITVDQEPNTMIKDQEPNTKITNQELSTNTTDHDQSTEVIDHEPNTKVIDLESITKAIDQELKTKVIDQESNTKVKGEEHTENSSEKLTHGAEENEENQNDVNKTAINATVEIDNEVII